MKNYDITQRCINLLKEIVAIPSVNPADQNSYDEKIYGEKNLVDFIYKYFKNHKHEFIIERYNILPGRDNIILFTGKSANKETILLETHMDTVDVTNMKCAAFSPILQGDRLYGRGACDAKGQIVSMITGLEMALDVTDGNLPINVCLALVVDEEHLHRGVDDLVRLGIKTSCAIVGEPTDLLIASASKGSIRFKIITKGIAAHTSTPDDGENAIYLMSKIIRIIEEKIEPEVGKNKHYLCGQSSISVSLIKGGEQVNIVPDRCEIHVDRRLIPGESWEDAYKFIKDTIINGLSEEENSRVIYEKPYLIDPYFETDKDSDVVDRLSKVLRRYNLPSEPVGLSFGCDASKITPLGIPTVVFGPGSIKQAHSKDEYITVGDLVKAAYIYRDLMMNI